MSALTRCKPRQRVEFKDPSGKVHNGVVIYLRSDTALVGVQNEARPFISVPMWDKAKEGYVSKSVPNNQLWKVPFADIILTETEESWNARRSADSRDAPQWTGQNKKAA